MAPAVEAPSPQLIVAVKLPGTSLESELENVATVPPTAAPVRPENVLPPVAAIGKLVTPAGREVGDHRERRRVAGGAGGRQGGVPVESHAVVLSGAGLARNSVAVAGIGIVLLAVRDSEGRADETAFEVVVAACQRRELLDQLGWRVVRGLRTGDRPVGRIQEPESGVRALQEAVGSVVELDRLRTRRVVRDGHVGLVELVADHVGIGLYEREESATAAGVLRLIGGDHLEGILRGARARDSGLGQLSPGVGVQRAERPVRRSTRPFRSSPRSSSLVGRTRTADFRPGRHHPCARPGIRCRWLMKMSVSGPADWMSAVVCASAPGAEISARSAQAPITAAQRRTQQLDGLRIADTPVPHRFHD